MHALALDLGGTKLATAIIDEQGKIIDSETVPLARKSGKEVGKLICAQVSRHVRRLAVSGIGVCVPGISHADGTVWAPNIAGWEAYPLLQEIRFSVDSQIPVFIECDRSCYILGESWMGAARGCQNAIFVSVGTGIGAGILVDGKVVGGEHGTAGSLGWMALEFPYDDSYVESGCLESQASGIGIVKLAKQLVNALPDYTGVLRDRVEAPDMTAAEIFFHYENGDAVALKIIDRCIALWGMAMANLISILNPEKIILGGGVFGPAARFIPEIRKEALRWAQPVASAKTSIEMTTLGPHAGVYGAGYLVLREIKSERNP